MCPLRPNPPDDQDFPDPEGWDNIEDAAVLAEAAVAAMSDMEEKDDEVANLDGSSVQIPHAIPEPPQPSKP